MNPRLIDMFPHLGRQRRKNPYPRNHFLHKVWSEALQVAEEEDSRLIASLQTLVDNHPYDEWPAIFWAKRFDIWAKFDIHFVQSDHTLVIFEKCLLARADAWMDLIARSWQDPPAGVQCDVALTNLRSSLVQRIHYWRAEALHYRAEQNRTPDPQRQRELSASVTPDVIKQRKRLIKKYRADHDLTQAGLARRLGMSETTIAGIVREEPKRFSPTKRESLLDALGIPLETWYRP